MGDARVAASPHLPLCRVSLSRCPDASPSPCSLLSLQLSPTPTALFVALDDHRSVRGLEKRKWSAASSIGRSQSTVRGSQSVFLRRDMMRPSTNTASLLLALFLLACTLPSAWGGCSCTTTPLPPVVKVVHLGHCGEAVPRGELTPGYSFLTHPNCSETTWSPLVQGYWLGQKDTNTQRVCMKRARSMPSLIPHLASLPFLRYFRR